MNRKEQNRNKFGLRGKVGKVDVMHTPVKRWGGVENITIQTTA